MLDTHMTTDELTGPEARRLREEKLSWSRQRLAKAAGMSTGTLERFETSQGRTLPANRDAILTTLRRVLRTVELETGSGGGVEEEYVEYAGFLRNLPPEHQAQALKQFVLIMRARKDD